MHFGCRRTYRYMLYYPYCAQHSNSKQPVATIVKSWVACFTRGLRCQRIAQRYLRFFFAATPLKI